MENLKIRNQKIINAIVEKSNKICPESLALIGITGSFATGDFYEKDNLTKLVRETLRVFQSVKKEIHVPKKVSADVIEGTYEEMFSNWRNKMYYASQRQDRHLAFMSIVNLNAMLFEISSEAEIGSYSVFDGYDPNDLQKTAQMFDDFLKDYLEEYRKEGIEPNRFGDIDSFVKRYLEKN